MVLLTIQVAADVGQNVCSLCGEPSDCTDGPQLVRANGSDRVCRNCGRRHAPSLVALLDLADTAGRIGRIGQHTSVPPLTALLELAKAAEEFFHTSPACSAG